MDIADIPVAKHERTPEITSSKGKSTLPPLTWCHQVAVEHQLKISHSFLTTKKRDVIVYLACTLEQQGVLILILQQRGREEGPVCHASRGGALFNGSLMDAHAFVLRVFHRLTATLVYSLDVICILKEQLSLPAFFIFFSLK